MLSVILACDDLYAAADYFVEPLGWTLVFATPPESDDTLACVQLGDAQVMLGTAVDEFLAPPARQHRGAGVAIYLTLREEDDIDAIHGRHLEAGVVTSELSQRPWGPRAFGAEILGYRFLVAEGGS